MESTLIVILKGLHLTTVQWIRVGVGDKSRSWKTCLETGTIVVGLKVTGRGRSDWTKDVLKTTVRPGSQ